MINYFEGSIEVETYNDADVIYVDRKFVVEYIYSPGYAATRYNPGEGAGASVISMCWADDNSSVTSPSDKQLITQMLNDSVVEMV